MQTDKNSFLQKFKQDWGTKKEVTEKYNFNKLEINNTQVKAIFKRCIHTKNLQYHKAIAKS